MLSNFVLLSLIRNAIPINPLANSGALGYNLLSTFTSMVPFLKSSPFIFMNVGSSNVFMVESFTTLRPSLPIIFTLDADTPTATISYFSKRIVCARMPEWINRIEVAKMIFEILIALFGESTFDLLASQ